MILNRRSHISLDRKPSQESFHLQRAPVFRVALAVEQDEAAGVFDVGAFGANGVVTHPNFTAKPVEQTRRLGLGASGLTLPVAWLLLDDLLNRCQDRKAVWRH